jgi:hypothetical protein
LLEQGPAPANAPGVGRAIAVLSAAMFQLAGRRRTAQFDLSHLPPPDRSYLAPSALRPGPDIFGDEAMKRLPLKHLALAAFAAVAAAPAALGDDVPFAQPPIARSDDNYLISLGDIMASLQMRHIKLWFALKARNWELASFESGLIEDSLANAAMLYRNIPIDNVTSAVAPLVALRDALKAKEGAKAEAAYADLTVACNACHTAAEVGFIRIQTPTSLPLSNQKFAPDHK